MFQRLPVLPLAVRGRGLLRRHLRAAVGGHPPQEPAAGGRVAGAGGGAGCVRRGRACRLRLSRRLEAPDRGTAVGASSLGHRHRCGDSKYSQTKTFNAVKVSLTTNSYAYYLVKDSKTLLVEGFFPADSRLHYVES